MGLFKKDDITDAAFIEITYNGNDRVFTSFYVKNHDEFFNFFRKDSNGISLDELYQESCLKIYNQILTGKLFVDTGDIFIRSRDGSVGLLKASLKTYLLAIGKRTLLELQRENRYDESIPIDNFGQDSDDDPGYDFEPVNKNHLYHNPLNSLYYDPEFDDKENLKKVVMIVEEMGSPCKEIFTYTYLTDGERKLKDDEIAKKMHKASADVIKNQRLRCQKKFEIACSKVGLKYNRKRNKNGENKERGLQ